jgi:hypothetical protein
MRVSRWRRRSGEWSGSSDDFCLGTLTPFTWPWPGQQAAAMQTWSEDATQFSFLRLFDSFKNVSWNRFCDIANVYKDQLPSLLAIHVKFFL